MTEEKSKTFKLVFDLTRESAFILPSCCFPTGTKDKCTVTSQGKAGSCSSCMWCDGSWAMLSLRQILLTLVLWPLKSNSQLHESLCTNIICSCLSWNRDHIVHEPSCTRLCADVTALRPMQRWWTGVPLRVHYFLCQNTTKSVRFYLLTKAMLNLTHPLKAHWSQWAPAWSLGFIAMVTCSLINLAHNIAKITDGS